MALPEHPAFLAFWLPIGVLIGIGTGAITTGVSTAAALAVAPERFAAAVGLNQTGRQVGGALGVAVLAALLDDPGPRHRPLHPRLLRSAPSPRSPSPRRPCG